MSSTLENLSLADTQQMLKFPLAGRRRRGVPVRR